MRHAADGPRFFPTTDRFEDLGAVEMEIDVLRVAFARQVGMAERLLRPSHLSEDMGKIHLREGAQRVQSGLFLEGPERRRRLVRGEGRRPEARPVALLVRCEADRRTQ